MKRKYTATPSAATPKRQRRAFALVLALALMGFMVLLVVTLASMVQMQMRMSRQNLNNFKAKQAAKFAAYQAMGNIQSALGPDTRITANAKMFDDAVNSNITALDSTSGDYNWWQTPMNITRDEADKIDDASISQNRYWVGVWDSRIGHVPASSSGGILSRHQLRTQSRANYNTATIKSAMTWLVSGNNVGSESELMDKGETTAVKYLPSRVLDSGKFVRVVTAASASDSYGNHDSNNDVLAPLVSLDVDERLSTGEQGNTSKETRIAWWVSDENQKASLNAISPYDFLKHSQSVKFRVQSLPFYSGAQGLTLGSNGERMYDLNINNDTGDETSTMSQARNALDIKDFDIIKSQNIPDGIVPSKVLFHSATTNSKGLLVNVKHGGLKKDLSLGLIRTDRGNEPEIIDNSPTEDIPSYFPRPYGVAGFYTKTTAYPIIYCTGNEWMIRRRENKPELVGIKYDSGTRFSGHMFGPQQYEREDEVQKFKTMSAISNSDFSQLYSDNNIWKDPGGPLWDQLRSYYNFRSPDLATDSKLSDRVQTDDRFGAKPVVRRFQVFFVPNFVNYGGSKYGLRLHIIPLMVLWNPYDTKIGGESYYVIRVIGFPYQMFTHALGTFRFAIGYQASGGSRFQCVRDLRTERLPAFIDKSYGGSEYIYTNLNYLRRFCFALTNYNTPDYAQPLTNGSGGNRQYSFDVYSNLNFGDEGSTATMATMRNFYSGFYSNSTAASRHGWTLDSKSWNALPLGYGELAPDFFRTGQKITTYNSNTTSGYSLNSEYGNLQSANETFAWITDETNIVPSLQDALTYKGLEEANQVGIRYAKRIAKIPLFLNNIYVSVAHGRNLQKLGRYKIFRGQMPIDQTDIQLNDETILSSHTYYRDAALHFMAYDPTGIPAGKAKIFAMESITNYVGDPTSTSRTDGYTDVTGGNGPNGFIEGENTMNLYTQKKCLMKPLGEGGNLGGCFYLDVPHPEVEHEAKWNNNIPYDNSLGNSSEKNNNIYVLFDITDLRNNTTDMDGNMPPSTIENYYIDMQDIVGFSYRFHHGDIGYTPYFMSLSATPLGYGLYTGISRISNNTSSVAGSIFSSSTTYDSPRFSSRYLDLNLDVWLYKREGMTFTNLNPRGKTSTPSYNSYFPDNAPTLISMSGMRVFSGDKFQSFPDPTLRRMVAASGSADIVNNYATQGLANRSTKSSGYNVNNSVSLKPINFYDRSTLRAKFPSTAAAEAALMEDYITNGGTFTPEQNARFYINWVPINPRRHTANSWPAFNNKPKASSNGRLQDQIGDLPPHALRGNSSGVISNSERTSGTYYGKLHSYCQNVEGAVPYGFLFMLPYGASESSDQIGVQPFMNRRLFVNGSLLTTFWNQDMSSQPMTSDNSTDRFTWQFGMLSKNLIATNQTYSESEVGLGGLSTLGYNVLGPSDTEAYIGLSAKNGTSELSTHHILRKTEVVSNVANLAGANLNYGAGKAEAGGDNREGGAPSYFTGSTDGQHPWQAAWGINVPESQQVSLAIGNSLCPSRIVPERSFHITWVDGSCLINNYNNANYGRGNFNGSRDTGTWYEDKSVVYDYSWHLNEVLWDEYFFSTFPYRKDEEDYAYKDSANNAYPQNPRMRYCVDSSEYLVLDDMLYDREKSNEQFDDNASKLWVDGAFNVNSTDVDAWKTVLSTYFGQTIESYDGDDSSNENRAPFHRWQAPLKATAVTADNASIHNETDLMTGYRSLDETEIEELAAAIVEHIKDRGPFYSMAEFVNRLVGNDSAEDRYMDKNNENLLDYNHQFRKSDRQNLTSEISSGGTSFRVGHMQKGVLQAAIDSTSINNQYHQDFILDKTNNVSDIVADNELFMHFTDPKETWENWRGAVGPQATGAPAYLMQQDILSRLGSFLTVRSDTFKIRAYGEVRNPISGAIEGKAWCEMTVQRIPEYIDSDNNKASDVYGRMLELGYQDQANQGDLSQYNVIMDESNGGLNGVNRTLGRRFKVVGFRWLNEKEI